MGGLVIPITYTDWRTPLIYLLSLLSSSKLTHSQTVIRNVNHDIKNFSTEYYILDFHLLCRKNPEFNISGSQSDKLGRNGKTNVIH